MSKQLDFFDYDPDEDTANIVDIKQISSYFDNLDDYEQLIDAFDDYFDEKDVITRDSDEKLYKEIEDALNKHYDKKQKTKSPEAECTHQWVATALVTSIVYDCKICGIKKEDVDKC